MLVPKCIYPRSIFAKFTWFACLLSFASLFLLYLPLNKNVVKNEDLNSLDFLPKDLLFVAKNSLVGKVQILKKAKKIVLGVCRFFLHFLWMCSQKNRNLSFWFSSFFLDAMSISRSDILRWKRRKYQSHALKESFE